MRVCACLSACVRACMCMYVKTSIHHIVLLKETLIKTCSIYGPDCGLVGSCNLPQLNC